jgi:MFS family permease
MSAQIDHANTGTSQDQSAAAGGPAWYVLFVLIVAYIFSFIDRQIISLLVEPLKHDLGLDDTQVSLLQGFSFALFLSLAGLPIGRLIDTSRRVTIVAIGIGLWSLMTAGSGLTSSFAALLFCRMGVGAGEAVLTPAAHSIIADSFPPKRLGLALGLYGTGTFLGLGLAYLIGAAVLAAVANGMAVRIPIFGPLRSWQIVFLAVGLPGLLVSLWSATLREPARRQSGISHPPIGEVVRFFKSNLATILWVNLTLAFAAMASYSASAWVPSFFIRTFGWTASQAGAAFGPLVMVFGVLGAVFGGLLADFAAKRYASGRVVVMAVASLLAVPFAAAAPLAPTPVWALTLMAPVVLLSTVTIGIGPSAQQAITPSRMRGVMSAIGVLTVNLIGLGLGPTAIALATDHIFADPLKIRYSLACLAPVMLLLSALFGILALKPYRLSLGKV